MNVATMTTILIGNDERSYHIEQTVCPDSRLLQAASDHTPTVELQWLQTLSSFLASNDLVESTCVLLLIVRQMFVIFAFVDRLETL